MSLRLSARGGLAARIEETAARTSNRTSRRRPSRPRPARLCSRAAGRHGRRRASAPRGSRPGRRLHPRGTPRAARRDRAQGAAGAPSSGQSSLRPSATACSNCILNSRSRSVPLSTARAKERTASLERIVEARQTEEVEKITAVLTELRDRILAELHAEPPPQLSLFDDDERDQLDRNRDLPRAARRERSRRRSNRRRPLCGAASPIPSLASSRSPSSTSSRKRSTPDEAQDACRRRRGGSVAAEHAEWLGLIDVSGPFLSIKVLLEAFPQGLDRGRPRACQEPPPTTQRVAGQPRGPQARPRHPRLLRPLRPRQTILELPDDLLQEGPQIPPTAKATLAEYRVTLAPKFAVGRIRVRRPCCSSTSRPPAQAWTRLSPNGVSTPPRTSACACCFAIPASRAAS